MRRKMMFLLTCLLLGVGLMAAQTKTASGTVKSGEDGQPIVGASIAVKGTTIGTITDVDGKFLISNIPGNANTLLVSFVGMKAEEVKIGRNLNITLTPYLMK